MEFTPRMGSDLPLIDTFAVFFLEVRLSCGFKEESSMQFFAVIFALSLFFWSPCPAADRDASPFLNTDQLGKLLEEAGYRPIALTREVFQITIDHQGWKVHLLVSLSKEGERVWLESKFSPIREPDSVPALTWRQLLEANDKIGPAHFVFDKSDKRVHILKAFDNHNITVDRLKKEIAALDATIRATHEVWQAEAFVPEYELLTVNPRVLEDAKTELASLQGEWQIVRIELRGKVVNEAQLEDSRPTLTFTDNSARLKTMRKVSAPSKFISTRTANRNKSISSMKRRRKKGFISVRARRSNFASPRRAPIDPADLSQMKRTEPGSSY